MKIFDSITSFPLDFKDIWFIGYISSWFKSKLHYFFISKVFWFNTLLNFISISKTFGSIWFEIYLLYLRLKDICFIFVLTIFASIFHFFLVFKKFGSTITYISSLLWTYSGFGFKNMVSPHMCSSPTCQHAHPSKPLCRHHNFASDQLLNQNQLHILDFGNCERTSRDTSRLCFIIVVGFCLFVCCMSCELGSVKTTTKKAWLLD